MVTLVLPEWPGATTPNSSGIASSQKDLALVGRSKNSLVRFVVVYSIFA